MRAECPWCKSQFDAHRAGRIFCPNCGAEIELPEPEPKAEPAHQRPQEPTQWGTPPPAYPPPGHPPPSEPRRPQEPTQWGPPPPAYPPTQPQVLEPPPWERMEELGFWRAFADTWKGASLDANRFFSRLAPGPLLPPFLYALLVGSVGSLGSSLWATSLWSAFGGGARIPFATELIPAVIGQAIGIWIFAGVVHVGCLLFGCASQGFGPTFRVVAYAAGPSLLGILPGGSFVAMIWTTVLAVIGIRWVQRTTSARAALAVLVIPVALTVGLMGLLLVALVAGLGGMWASGLGGGWPT